MPLRATVALLVGLLLPVWDADAGRSARRRACREGCSAAIEACIAYMSAPLRDADISPRRLRRKAKRIRRDCTKRAYRQCRESGEAACAAPLECDCGA